MIIKNLSKRGSAIGPEDRLPDGIPYGIRLIADEGMILSKDDILGYAVDLYPPHESERAYWTEIEDPNPPPDDPEGAIT